MGNGSQFDGIGFAAGVVTGARSFKVDKLGRLTGVVHEKVWRPGENDAECLKDEDQSNGYYNFMPYSRMVMKYTLSAAGTTVTPTISYEPEPEKPKRRAKKPAHSLDKCACGFYGYYDGSNDYHDRANVSGVIEGYGEVVIGTRGFRAMKARIVALRLGPGVPLAQAALVRRNYGEIPIFDSFKAMIAAFPTDAGDVGITPDNDEEFWTRDV